MLRDQVATSLAGVATDVEVIGSASVLALLAKPIIDLAVGVPDGLPVSAVTERLEPEGWIYRSDQGTEGGHVFVLEARPWHRVAHLHVVEHDGRQWRNYLRLRDTLRSNAEARERYEAAKLRLIDQEAANRTAYTLGKSEVIASLLRASSEELPAWATEAIHVVEHDPNWVDQAARYAGEVSALFVDWLTSEVMHIGSTAVPDLPAKPIIDLQATADDPAAAIKAVAETAADDGWMFVPRPLDRRPWRWLLVRINSDASRRLAHLHLMPPHQQRWHDQVLFRDRLRSSAILRNEYTQLKRRAAAMSPVDREAYGRAKTEFVLMVLRNSQGFTA